MTAPPTSESVEWWREPMKKAVPPDPLELPADRLARRTRILQTAFELLENDEYANIQMREVAEAAKMSLGTLYRYFASKEHLYAATLLEWSTDFDLDDENLIPGASDEERIRGLLMRAVGAFERRPQVLRAEIALESSTDPNVQQLFEQFTDRHLEVMLHALHDVRPADGQAIVDTLVAVLGARTRSWALGRSTIHSVRKTIDRSVDLVFNGPKMRPTAGNDDAVADCQPN